MRRVIRNQSGLYFKKDGSWTSNHQEAYNFSNASEAISAMLSNNLTEVSLVLIVGAEPNQQYDIILPL
jgi:hypothetical protein